MGGHRQRQRRRRLRRLRRRRCGALRSCCCIRCGCGGGRELLLGGVERVSSDGGVSPSSLRLSAQLGHQRVEQRGRVGALGRPAG